jgi:hypothetical protein
MASRIENPGKNLILEILDRAFDKRSWHGPNLRASIKGVNMEQALWRPSEKGHCIWELVLHSAYWKYIVRRKIESGKRGSFARKGSNWFKLGEPTEASWKDDIDLLENEHKLLCQSVSNLHEIDFRRNPSNSSWPLVQMILGAASHDLYHAGQIQLLKRIYKAAK